MEKLKAFSKGPIKYFYAFFKWILIASVTGATGGVVGGAFHKFIDYATSFRNANPYMLYFLPVGGIVIVFFYRLFGMKKDPGTNLVLSSVRSEETIPAVMSPLIFLSTVITHLCGGSAGREGAALQLGGSIGCSIGKLFKLDSKDMHEVVLCGMSAVFSALFCTPVTAAIFAIEVISVGVVYYASLVPCIVASYVACAISMAMGNVAAFYELQSIPPFNAMVVVKIIAVAAVCGLFSIVLCIVMKHVHRSFDIYIKNQYLRSIAGGCIVILLTFLVRTRDYNGAGMDVIKNAMNGNVVWYAFLIKLIFTAVTIGSGFKGGEIVPTFFMGATLGCLLGKLVGLDGGFCAAIGLVALFCGVVNCPVASIILSVELFGSKGIILFAVASAVSYMLSGNYGLYSTQKIIYSKIKNEYIDENTK